jgi:hypothetical protein
MLDEAAEIGDEQGTDSKNGIAAVCALFETRSREEYCLETRGYLDRGGQRQMVW